MNALEPQKALNTPEETEKGSAAPQAQPSVVQDFEALGPKDDPFVAVEMGTINDLEELRDVLASIEPASNPVATIETEGLSSKQNTYQPKPFSGSLKNITFPRLSTDETTVDNPPSQPQSFFDTHTASAPGSQTNLYRLRPVAMDEERPSTMSPSRDKSPASNHTATGGNSPAPAVGFSLAEEETTEEKEEIPHEIEPPKSPSPPPPPVQESSPPEPEPEVKQASPSPHPLPAPGPSFDEDFYTAAIQVCSYSQITHRYCP